MEGICPGLFYMFLSQATDIGTENDRTTSATFFYKWLNRERIMNLTRNSKGELYDIVQKEKNGPNILCNIYIKKNQQHQK